MENREYDLSFNGSLPLNVKSRVCADAWGGSHRLLSIAFWLTVCGLSLFFHWLSLRFSLSLPVSSSSLSSECFRNN